MIIMVDGAKRQWDYNDENTLGEVILDINNRLREQEHLIVTTVKLDETAEGIDMSLTPDEVTIDLIKQISFETEPLHVNLINNMHGAIAVIEEIRKAIPGIGNLILQDKIEESMGAIRDIIEKLIWVFHILSQTLSTGAFKASEIKCGENKNFEQFTVDFNRILQELTNALENNDVTLINDFLEYELDPALDELAQGAQIMCTRVEAAFKSE